MQLFKKIIETSIFKNWKISSDKMMQQQYQYNNNT